MVIRGKPGFRGASGYDEIHLRRVERVGGALLSGSHERTGFDEIAGERAVNAGQRAMPAFTWEEHLEKESREGARPIGFFQVHALWRRTSPVPEDIPLKRPSRSWSVSVGSRPRVGGLSARSAPGTALSVRRRDGPRNNADLRAVPRVVSRVLSRQLNGPWKWTLLSCGTRARATARAPGTSSWTDSTWRCRREWCKSPSEERFSRRTVLSAGILVGSTSAQPKCISITIRDITWGTWSVTRRRREQWRISFE